MREPVVPPGPLTIKQIQEIERNTWDETKFQRQTLAIARGLGFKCVHFRPARTGRKDDKGRAIWVTPIQGDAEGWPDLAMFRGKRKIAWELKVEPNKPTPEQLEWLDVLEKAEFEVAVCYPCHWETMMRILEQVP